MKYISLDLETTSIDVKNAQILQLAAIATDTKNVNYYDSFECKFQYDQIFGMPMALQMNSWLLKNMVDNPETTMKPEDALEQFFIWLVNLGEGNFLNGKGTYKKPYELILAGKNVSSFDIPILLNNIEENSTFNSVFSIENGRLRFNDFYFKIAHRSLDPGNMYVRKDDERVPGNLECAKRAGINIEEISHNALDDAQLVIDMINKHFEDN